MNGKKCFEQYLYDVVALSVYRDGDCQTSLAPVIPRLRELSLSVEDSPALRVSIAVSDDGVNTEQPPVLSVATSRTAAGTLFTHDLQISVSDGREAAENAVNQLQGEFFHVVYEYSDGRKRMSYALPNTSVIDIEEKSDNGNSVTIKIKMQSLSSVVDIVEDS